MGNSFANPNTFASYWSRRMQMKHERTDVYRALANFQEEAKLTSGDTVYRPYRSNVLVQNYTRGTAFTVQDLSNTEEHLHVDTAKIAPFYIDDLDALQSNYPLINDYADDSAVQLGNTIDGDFLSEVTHAGYTVDDGTLGGTAGNAITVTSSNISKIFTSAAAKLDEGNVAQDGRFAVLSARVYQTLIESLAGRETSLGDSTGINGAAGKYMGFDLYKSNGSLFTADLVMTVIPANTNTVTINGVVFTFVDTLGSAAGNVHICSDAAKTLTNFVAALNAPGTAVASGTDAGYVPVSAADQFKLRGLVASESGTTLTITVSGRSYFPVSETITDAGDVWTAGKQVQHLMFGRKGCVDMVIQKRPNVEIKEVPDKLGKNIAPWTLYGKKTFAEGAAEMVKVDIATSTW